MSSEQPLGRYPLPDPRWLLPMGPELDERVDRRLKLAIEGLSHQLTPLHHRLLKEAFTRGQYVGVAGIVEDEYRNTWYQLTLDGGPISRIATGTFGMWLVEGQWRYCPDPYLDEDLVQLLELGDEGPWGDP